MVVGRSLGSVLAMVVDDPAAVARYPVLLDLRDRPCLVVGGGPVAARKVRGLLVAAARVRVIAAVVGPEVAALDHPGLDVHEREVAVADLLGPDGRGGEPWAFVVAATDDAKRNGEVVAEAGRRGTWANDATDPRGGPASLPAVHRDGPITIAVATGGAHPGAATWLRDRAGAAIGPAPAVAIDLIDRFRRDRPGTGRVDWRTVVDSGMLVAISEGRLAEAKERLEACLSSSSD